MNKPDTPNVFTIDGNIQAIQIAPGIVNLIEDIQNGSCFTGLVAGLVGEAGILANASSIATYDGEDVEHVALLLNGKLAIGTFESLQDLRMHDEVKLVVSGIPDGPLFVHAILRKNDQLLWTPFSVDHTRHGWVKHGIKLGSLIVLFTWLMFGLFYLIDGRLPSKLEWFWLGVFPILEMAFVVFMSLNGVMHLGDEAEGIFQALDVPKHKLFRIKSFSIFNLDYMKDSEARNKKYVFRFAEALAAHKKKFNLS